MVATTSRSAATLARLSRRSIRVLLFRAPAGRRRLDRRGQGHDRRKLVELDVEADGPERLDEVGYRGLDDPGLRKGREDHLRGRPAGSQMR